MREVDHRMGIDAHFAVGGISDRRWREVDEDMGENRKDPRLAGLNEILEGMMSHSGAPESLPRPKKKSKKSPKVQTGKIK